MADNTLQDRFLGAVESLKLKFPVSEIAEKTGYGQPIVSTYLNGRQSVSTKFLKSFCEAFKLDFEAIMTGIKPKGEEKADPSPMQILAVLAEAFKAQAEMMRNIEKEMARKDIQATMSANLIEVLAGVEVLSLGQEKGLAEIEKLLSLQRAGREKISQGDDKRPRGTGEVG